LSGTGRQAPQAVVAAVEAALLPRLLMGYHGVPMETHVTILKNFRDTYLLPCAFGRTFVRIYNKYSPPLAHFISKHEILKVTVRICLLPLVAISYSTLEFGPTITATGVLLIFVLLIFPISVYRRRALGRGRGVAV